MMLEWLKLKRPRMTVDQLKTEIEKIKRADALLILDGYLSAKGMTLYLKHSNRPQLRLLRTFAGVLPCPSGKNSYARHFEGKHGKLYIVGKLNKCRFREKNMNCQFF